MAKKIHTKTMKSTENTTAEPKTVANKYQILKELGKGGMGVVYKAKDLRLNRTVALKFLAAGLIKDREAQKRFIQEAQAASSLDHTNICTIYEIDETKEKDLFISMAYYAGESLDEKMSHGSMDINDVRKIADQIALGLTKAHKKGIIHRDIKPANILITDEGVVKIVDFGIAKLTGQVKITQPGSTLGTAAYMSPEQARGDEVDLRTDIWSLGVVLYEMLTGELPFEAEQAQAVTYAILNKEPKSLAAFRSDIPKNIQTVVEKALAKDVAQRYRSFDEFRQDLNPPLLSIPRAEKSIVVLPFDDLSPGGDNEYFSDGLTEEIITDLSLVPGLLVISRNSAMTLKGTKKDTKTIGQELNVQYVLEGSVRKAGNNLRIIAQLIDAASDVHIWAEKYMGTMDDIFDIQEKVSRSIADALKLKLTPAEKQKIAERGIDNVSAYECYLKAYREIWRFSEESLDRAVDYLKNGLDIIGENAYLYTAMAQVYLGYSNIMVDSEHNIDIADEYVKKALALDPDFSKAHAVLGWIQYWIGKNQKAAQHFRHALDLNPNEFAAWHGLGAICVWAGKLEMALSFLERLQRIDPLNPYCYLSPAAAYFHAGKYEIALEKVKKAYEVDPENVSIRFYYVYILAYNQQLDKAIPIIDQSVKDAPNNVFTKLCVALKYAIKENKKYVFREMTQDFLEVYRREPGWAYMVGVLYALLDEKDLALEWLEQAVDSGYMNYPWLAERDPFLENVRSEERFKKLLEKAKHAWDHFEV